MDNLPDLIYNPVNNNNNNIIIIIIINNNDIIINNNVFVDLHRKIG